MTKLYISLGLLTIKSCLKGNLERYDLKIGQQIEFVDELELANVVLTEVNSLYLFADKPTIALTDNSSIIKEYENVIDIVPFPTSQNDLPVIHRAIVACQLQ